MNGMSCFFFFGTSRYLSKIKFSPLHTLWDENRCIIHTNYSFFFSDYISYNIRKRKRPKKLRQPETESKNCFVIRFERTELYLLGIKIGKTYICWVYVLLCHLRH